MAEEADDPKATAPTGTRTSVAPDVNEVEAGASRTVMRAQRETDERPSANTAPLSPDDERAKGLPQSLRDRYLQVGDRYFRDASAKDAAFEDHGTRLRGADAGVARDLVAIAGHRGWQEIQVRGSEEFRREVWREASALGIAVSGYRPSELERAELRRAAEGTISRVDRSDPGARGNETRDATRRPDFNAGITGRVVAIGAEKYDDRARSTTPYLDIEAEDGRKHRAWGVALDEAVREASVKVGDQATIRRAAREPVEVTTDEGRIAAERNRWTISVDRETQKAAPSRDTGSADHGPGHDLAERFLRQGHVENARDPKLRAAQSHVMLAQAAARQRHGGDDQAVDRAVKAAKIDVATRLSRGQTIEAVQIKDRGRAQAEQTREMLFRDRQGRSR